MKQSHDSLTLAQLVEKMTVVGQYRSDFCFKSFSILSTISVITCT